MSTYRSYLRWVPALLWMGTIFYLSSRTGGELQSFFPFITNFNPGHIVAYFILALFYRYAFGANTAFLQLKEIYQYLIPILLCLFYGLTDEWHQMYVPTRSPDWLDIVNDTFGATLAMMMFYFWNKRVLKGRKRNK